MTEPSASENLIVRAFALARESGKPDWWAMTIPVLKNRLLLLTNKGFKEADFGAVSFRDFLYRNSEIVRVEEIPHPGYVILRNAVPQNSQLPPRHALLRRKQIRPDLWRAIVDYSGGRQYVWDSVTQRAQPAEPDDQRPVLPTISHSDLDAWRSEFVEINRPQDIEEAKAVEIWKENRLPTAALPVLLRPTWNSYLKKKVQNRIEKWFEQNGFESPVFDSASVKLPPVDPDLAELRAFITRCVGEMSLQELQELRIPPAIAMRLSRSSLRGQDGP